MLEFEEATRLKELPTYVFDSIENYKLNSSHYSKKEKNQYLITYIKP